MTEMRGVDEKIEVEKTSCGQRQNMLRKSLQRGFAVTTCDATKT